MKRFVKAPAGSKVRISLEFTGGLQPSSFSVEAGNGAVMPGQAPPVLEFTSNVSGGTVSLESGALPFWPAPVPYQVRVTRKVDGSSWLAVHGSIEIEPVLAGGTTEGGEAGGGAVDGSYAPEVEPQAVQVRVYEEDGVVLFGPYEGGGDVYRTADNVFTGVNTFSAGKVVLGGGELSCGTPGPYWKAGELPCDQLATVSQVETAVADRMVVGDVLDMEGKYAGRAYEGMATLAYNRAVGVVTVPFQLQSMVMRAKLPYIPGDPGDWYVEQIDFTVFRRVGGTYPRTKLLYRGKNPSASKYSSWEDAAKGYYESREEFTPLEDGYTGSVFAEAHMVHRNGAEPYTLEELTVTGGFGLRNMESTGNNVCNHDASGFAAYVVGLTGYAVFDLESDNAVVAARTYPNVLQPMTARLHLVRKSTWLAEHALRQSDVVDTVVEGIQAPVSSGGVYEAVKEAAGDAASLSGSNTFSSDNTFTGCTVFSGAVVMGRDVLLSQKCLHFGCAANSLSAPGSCLHFNGERLITSGDFGTGAGGTVLASQDGNNVFTGTNSFSGDVFANGSTQVSGSLYVDGPSTFNRKVSVTTELHAVSVHVPAGVLYACNHMLDIGRGCSLFYNDCQVVSLGYLNDTVQGYSPSPYTQLSDNHKYKYMCTGSSLTIEFTMQDGHTAELWLDYRQPTALTWPSGLRWKSGDTFSSDASAMPSFVAGRTYCIVLRRHGDALLAQVAYYI